MKFINISPFKSQNITNFTFWKVILLEIHEVHLIQRNQFLGTTNWDGLALISSLKWRFCWISLPTYTKMTSTSGGLSELFPGFTVKQQTLTFGLSQAAAHQKKLFCPKRSPPLLVTRCLQLLPEGRKRPTALLLATSATDRKKFPYSVQMSDMKKWT